MGESRGDPLQSGFAHVEVGLDGGESDVKAMDPPAYMHIVHVTIAATSTRRGLERGGREDDAAGIRGGWDGAVGKGWLE